MSPLTLHMFGMPGAGQKSSLAMVAMSEEFDAVMADVDVSGYAAACDQLGQKALTEPTPLVAPAVILAVPMLPSSPPEPLQLAGNQIVGVASPKTPESTQTLTDVPNSGQHDLRPAKIHPNDQHVAQVAVPLPGPWPTAQPTAIDLPQSNRRSADMSDDAGSASPALVSAPMPRKEVKWATNLTAESQKFDSGLPASAQRSTDTGLQLQHPYLTRTNSARQMPEILTSEQASNPVGPDPERPSNARPPGDGPQASAKAQIPQAVSVSPPLSGPLFPVVNTMPPSLMPSGTGVVHLPVEVLSSDDLAADQDLNSASQASDRFATFPRAIADRLPPHPRSFETAPTAMPQPGPRSHMQMATTPSLTLQRQIALSDQPLDISASSGGLSGQIAILDAVVAEPLPTDAGLRGGHGQRMPGSAVESAWQTRLQVPLQSSKIRGPSLPGTPLGTKLLQGQSEGIRPTPPTDEALFPSQPPRSVALAALPNMKVPRVAEAEQATDGDSSTPALIGETTISGVRLAALTVETLQSNFRPSQVDDAKQVVLPTGLLPKVAAEIVAHAQKAEVDAVEVMLQPDELGSVRFQISQQGESVRVVFSAEHPETLDLMRRHAELLMQELRQAGFSGATLSFGSWGHQGGQRDTSLPQPILPQPDEPSALLSGLLHAAAQSDVADGGQGLNLRL